MREREVRSLNAKRSYQPPRAHVISLNQQQNLQKKTKAQEIEYNDSLYGV